MTWRQFVDITIVTFVNDSKTSSSRWHPSAWKTAIEVLFSIVLKNKVDMSHIWDIKK